MKSNKQIPKTGLQSRKSGKPISIKVWRIRFVHICLNLVSIVLILRLFQIQVLGHEKYSRMAREQHLGYYTKKARRGEILDRNRKPLALNEPCYDLGFDKRQVIEYSTTSKKLSAILNADPGELHKQIRNNSQFGFIQRKLEPAQAEEIRQEKLPGVVLIESSKRHYPLNEKLAQEIGFVGIDGNGLSGLEYQLDDYLRGEDGESILQKDATGRNIMTVTAREQTNGHMVILTIDHVIQTIIEEELAAALDKFQAEAGSVVVVNPQNGEILAMASLPGFDANKAEEFGPEAWRIRCVTDVFEPGSTFKIATLLGAIEKGSIKLDQVFDCEQGKFKLYGETITDHEKYGNLTFREIIVNSSNIGTAKVALKIGKNTLFDAARRLGFGNATGIDLPGEVNGLYKKPTQWSRFSVAGISYGYEVAVTPIQMTMAYAAVANDGLLLKPYLVKEIISPEGKTVEKGKTHVVRQVMQPETAQTMRPVLESVVEHGTGKLAKIPGRNIAGKTGTAKKLLAGKHGYSDSKYVASFAGFYPVENARFLIHVVLDEPKKRFLRRAGGGAHISDHAGKNSRHLRTRHPNHTGPCTRDTFNAYPGRYGKTYRRCDRNSKRIGLKIQA